MPQPRPRSYVGLLAALIGGGVFLLVYPAVEREAHLRNVANSDPTTTVEALRRLCWIRAGVERLDELLPQLEMDRRREVLSAAVELGCLEQLEPPLQATYYLLTDDGVDVAAGFGADVVSPALELLSAPSPAMRQRASRVLSVVRPRLADGQRARVVEAIPNLPDAAVIRELQIAFGMPSPDPRPPPAGDMGQAELLADVDIGRDAVEQIDAGVVPVESEERLVPALSAPRLIREQVEAKEAAAPETIKDIGSIEPPVEDTAGPAPQALPIEAVSRE